MVVEGGVHALEISKSLYIYTSLVTRTGYFLVCSCAARRSGLVFIEIAYSQLLLSLKLIWMGSETIGLHDVMQSLK